ncbi:MAG TPA: DinB family protein, partial [Caldimonas sp.]
MTADARRLAGRSLADALRDARATTLARTMDVDDVAWRVPQQAGINPIAWELGHLAWFAEFWILRGPHRLGDDGLVVAAKPPAIAGPDAVFDSARLAHGDRWHVELPSRGDLLARLDRQLIACLDRVPRNEDDDAANYFHRLALFHEDMHGEALAWLRATLGWPAPAGTLPLPALPASAPLAIAGGELVLGHAAGGRGFAFDNEEPSRAMHVGAFEIDATPVTNA